MIKLIGKPFFAGLAILALTSNLFAQTASLLPNAVQQFFDNNGNPLTSGTVTTYIPGTSTLKTTWQNSAESVVNTNPINLDAGGKAIIYGQGTYRQVVKDALDNLIWDAVTAPGGGGGSPTLIGDGQQVGSMKPWAGITAPNQYAFAAGQELNRTTYADLFTAITQTANVGCTSGSAVLTGFSNVNAIRNGGEVEVSCMPSGTVVVSKSPTTVTTNNPSNVTLNTSATIFMYGNGNGSTTFNIPDLRGRVITGADNMGGSPASRLSAIWSSIGTSGGIENQTLITSNLPPYTPVGSVSGTASGSVSGPVSISDPGHVHVYSQYPVTNTGSATTVGGSQIIGNPGNSNTASSTTGITASFSASLSSGSISASFSGSAQGGTSTPFLNMQPTMSLNYIIKITPDVNQSSNDGVASLGGMTGVIACGDGLLCTGNIISANASNVRQRLASDISYYVNSSASTTGQCGAFTCQPGNDLNTGLTVADPFQTIQKSIDVIKAGIDFAGPFRANVQLTCGRNYTATGNSVVMVNGPFTGSQRTTNTFPSRNEVPVTIVGNAADTSCATLDSTTHNTVEVISSSTLGIEGVTVNSTGGTAIDTGNASFIVLGNIAIGPTLREKIFSHHSSTIESFGTISISGNSGSPVFDTDFFGTMYIASPTVTMIGNITAPSFAHSGRNSDLSFGSTIATGGFTFTGKRFVAENGGNITSTLGGTAGNLTYFPGTLAGDIVSGGAYDGLTLLTTALGINASGVIPSALIPGTTLFVQNSSGNSTTSLLESNGTSTAPFFIGRMSRGTAAARTASQSGDVLGVFGGLGYGATTYTTTANSAIASAATENFSDTAHGSELQIYTTPNGSITNTQRFNFGQAGGLYAVSATGGDKGVGTGNFHTGLYVDGSAVALTSSVRERLAADRTYYINSSASTTGPCGAFTCQPGSDTTGTGLTIGAPFQTIQKAIDTIKANIDSAGIYRANIQLTCGRNYTASGTPVAQVNGPWTGSQPSTPSFQSRNEITVTIVGDTANTSCATLDSSTHNTIEVVLGGGLSIEGVTITSTGNSAIDAGGYSAILLGNLALGATATSKVFVHHGSIIENYGDLTLSGNSTSSVFNADYFGSLFLVGHNITMTGNITTPEFVLSSRNSEATITATIATGGFTLTGKRFTAINGGNITTTTAGTAGNLTFYPGTLQGTVTSGAAYDGLTMLTSPLLINGGSVAGPTAFLGTMLTARAADGTGTVSAVENFGGAAAYFLTRSARGTAAAPTASQSGDLIGLWGAQGYGATGFSTTTTNGALVIAAAGNFSDTSQPTELQLYTTPTGSTTVTKRFSISQAGGLFATGVTGGDKGIGTINATTIYQNNVAVALPETVTTQNFITAGASGTYTTPGGVKWIEITMVGAGGGGGGSGTGPGTGGNGGNTCWNTTGAACTTPVYQAGGGVGGSVSGTSAAGGTVSGSGTPNVRSISGGTGGAAAQVAGAFGGVGGSASCGVGTAQIAASPGGNPGATATGFGNGGGGATTSLTTVVGGGAGGGACLITIINAPAATYTYATGAVGTTGTAGGTGVVGGSGALPGIWVVEHYN